MGQNQADTQGASAAGCEKKPPALWPSRLLNYHEGLLQLFKQGEQDKKGLLVLDAEAVFKTSLTHSSQAGTRFASSVPVQIGSGNVSGLDCEGSSLAKYALPTAPSRPVR